MTIPAVLVLADGTIFEGISMGQEGQTQGEVVLNTSAFGYQEALTDPSSSGQIIAFTYPHIGNTGMNLEDEQSDRVRAAGLVIRDLPILASNFRSIESLADYLRRYNIIGIAEIDTRRLTRHLRAFGTQAGCIVSGNNPDLARAQAKAQAFGSLAGKNLVSEISAEAAYEWTERQWHLGEAFEHSYENPLHVVVYDFGVTRDELRVLSERGCQVTVVPAWTKASEVLVLNPNGVYLSSGAGDPRALHEIAAEIKSLISAKIPLFAVGLGHQLLAMAMGAQCEKLALSVQLTNHPVQDTQTGSVIMTSQNRIFTVLESTLPENVSISYRALADGAVEGLSIADQVAYSFQSAANGDASFLLDQLIEAMWAN